MSNIQRVMKALHPREYKDRQSGEMRTFWHEIGIAYVTDQGVDVVLHLLPPPGPTGYRILLRERDPEADQQRRDQRGGYARGGQGGGRGYGQGQGRGSYGSGYGGRQGAGNGPSEGEGGHTYGRQDGAGAEPPPADDDPLPF